MSKSSKRTTFPVLGKPVKDDWVLNWSRIDQSGPFAWPSSNTRMFYNLAGYLARLNNLPLEEVGALQRVHGGSAVHELTTKSDAANDRWAEIYEKGRLDSPDEPDLALITMTYCIDQADARRVIVALDAQNRKIYPIWWDEHHLVSGTGRVTTPKHCSSEKCHHLPDRIE